MEQPPLTGPAWRELKRALYLHDWVVYAKEPRAGPARAIECLGRYIHRVAISNERMLAIDEKTVSLSILQSP